MQDTVYECTDILQSRRIFCATEQRQMNAGNKVYHQPKLRPLSPGLSLITSLTGWAPVSTDSWAVSPRYLGHWPGHWTPSGDRGRENGGKTSGPRAGLVTLSSYLGTYIPPCVLRRGDGDMRVCDATLT